MDVKGPCELHTKRAIEEDVAVRRVFRETVALGLELLEALKEQLNDLAIPPLALGITSVACT